jgi:hypothetical protein
MMSIKRRLQSSQLDFNQSRIREEGQALSDMYCMVCKGSPGARELVGAGVPVIPVEAVEALGTEPAVREGSTSTESDASGGTGSEADWRVAMQQGSEAMIKSREELRKMREV